jgi:DNA-binding phage protein
MTTSPKMLLTDAIFSDEPLTAFQQAYFDERYRNRLHAEVLRLFENEAKRNGLTKANLARRLNKRPEQLTRWLSAPGNWTLETVSRLMLAMHHEPAVGAIDLTNPSRSNQYHPLSTAPIVPGSAPSDSGSRPASRWSSDATVLQSSTT